MPKRNGMGVRRKRLRRQLKKRGACNDDDVVVAKGAQLTMSASPVAAEVEKPLRGDDARGNKSGKVESTQWW
jgi:hypothetical protein